MQITLDWLKEKNACIDGIKFFEEHFGAETDHKELITTLLKHGHYDYAFWIISTVLSTIDCIKFAAYCAELVLHVFEDKYLHDERPKKAILTAKKFVKNNNYAAVSDAYYVAYVAYAAAHDAANDAVDNAYAANDAVDNATYAADAAAHAAACADAYASAASAYSASSADAADNAAYAAYTAATNAANAAKAAVADRIREKIINYGLKLIDEEEKI